MSNMKLLILLIPVLPLIGFIITGLGRNFLSKSLSGLIGSVVVLASLVISFMAFLQVRESGSILATYFDFIKIHNLHIAFDFFIDPLTSIFLLVITGVGFLIHVYSIGYMHGESSKDFSKYFSFLNLFVFSMLLLVIANNFAVMYIGWEGVGLCSYLLIGYWFKNPEYTSAGKKAFVMNRIGDFGFLLAVFWVISRLGTTSFSEVFTAESLAKLSQSDITGITLLLFLGATAKSAQLPLYTWLPDAMAGPTPVSALIHAATMVTAGVYLIARSNVWYTMAPFTQGVIAVVSIATMLLAASIALKQNDIKKVLAYSTVSQLGYMFLALSVGAYTAAVFHVMTHAFFKALLFLGAGSVIHAMGGEQDMQVMGGLKNRLKITHITMLIACLAIAGIPPLSGFFSKDEILSASFMKSPMLWGLGVFGALLTAFYMFRLYAMTFLGKFRGSSEQEAHLHESPSSMTLPLLVLAGLSIVGGFIGIPEAIMSGAHQLGDFLAPVFAPSAKLMGPHTVSHNTEYILMAVSAIVAIAAMIVAWNKFSKYTIGSEKDSRFGTVLRNKWYIDEFYEKIILQPLKSISHFFNNTIDIKGIDGVVNGVGSVVQYASRQLRYLQSGQIGGYVLLMVLGFIALLIIQLFL